MRWLLHKANGPMHMVQRVLMSPKTKAEFKRLPYKGAHKVALQHVPRWASPSLVTTTASLKAPPGPGIYSTTGVHRVANKGYPEVLRSSALTHRPGRSPRLSICKAERHKVG